MLVATVSQSRLFSDPPLSIHDKHSFLDIYSTIVYWNLDGTSLFSPTNILLQVPQIQLSIQNLVSTKVSSVINSQLGPPQLGLNLFSFT